jgi:predicted transposase/invertase (TIGR01784 family)
MTKLKVRPKVDIAFKKIFADNEELLKELIIGALDLKVAKNIILKPNEVTPATPDEKFCRFDIRAEVDGREIDIEIQLAARDDFRARAEYYSSLLFTHLKKGKDYNELPKAIVICFIDFNAFGCSEYHSKFLMLETKRYELLTDKREIHFFELKKIPTVKNAQNKLEYLLNVIGAETEEDIKELDSVQDETIRTALTEVRRLNADEEFIRKVAAREIQMYEEQSALSAAESKGELKERVSNIKALLADGMLLDKIISLFNISDDELIQIKPLLD